MGLRPLHAFLVGFAIGFIAGFAFIGVGFGWLSFLVPAQVVFEVQLAVGVIVGAVFGGLGLGFFYLGGVLGRKGLLAIAALLFLLGIVLVQPEADALALLPLAFAIVGTGKRGR